MSGSGLGSVTAVQYTIAPKPGSVSSAVHVEYSIAALQARGYVGDGTLTVPVYGLYAGYDNQVSVELTRQGEGALPFEVDIATDAYVDPTGIYSNPNIVLKRAAGSSLGFNFIYIKSNIYSPIIVDTDGEIRWAVPVLGQALSSAFVGDTFIVGSDTQPMVYRLGLDGGLSALSLPTNSPAYAKFGHDIDDGKAGLLAEIDENGGGVEDIESNVVEMQVTNAVTVVNHWDLGAIISNYMTSQGDDAAAFVRPGVDWFHLNSAIYDPSDDSVIVSSRENFIIKLDYSTGAIKWIFGDPTKYWYTFPSLRAKALTLAPGGLYPIGQHALSITPDGLLMVFNDGLGSFNQPAGQSAGQSRTYSAVSAYSIDPQSMTATDVWDYDADQTIYSDVCSSAYESSDKSLLVDYAVADNQTEAILVGLDPNHNKVFEFQYPTKSCNTSWNSRPIGLEDLQINQ
ncbi:MAG TPA: aryl-sulfate sulfotransferase [Steroidobacteraceae bacterium]|nr:aryl-sulfate sulfotransferase [Steroidobacteraceae bacterium]